MTYIPDGPGFGPWGGGGFWHILTFVVGGFVWLLAIALMLAVLFFLIRFLLVATRAAQIYVHQHSPAEPARPVRPAATASTTVVPPADTTAVTKPLPKPRTPRKPTT